MSALQPANNAANQGTSVRVRDLCVTAANQVLLKSAQADFPPGEITLIVGASGVGKSVLLRVLAGLIPRDDPEVRLRGSIRVGENEVLAARAAGPRVGVVFQQFALFDELTPTENVQFAADHRPRPTPNARSAKEWLAELRVPPNVRTSALSGGQRQRLAIARSLACQPDVILYDEPTSGLDPVSSRHVASLIQATHAAHRQTSIVVTHDHQALATIADRVYLVDPRTQSLVLVPREEWSRLSERIELPPRVLEEEAEPKSKVTQQEPGRWGSTLRGQALRAWKLLSAAAVATSRCAEQVLLLPWRALPRWRSPWWGLRALGHYLWLVAGPTALLYMAITGAIIGFVATYFTFRFLPYRSYTEPLIIEDLLGALGFALYRILVPVLATVLVSARSGAAVASDVGGKTYSQQVDAMRTLGADPSRYLATNILWAFLLGTPVLTAVAFACARLTSLAVFTATHASFGPYFWDLHFHQALLQQGSDWYQGTAWLVTKLLVCAACVGVVAYERGVSAKRSGKDVSLGITSTILWSTLLVLLAHFAFAFIEFEETR